MAALIISLATVSAQRIADVRVEAQYITDKMAAELGLSSSQRGSVLSLNLAYLSGITSYRDIDSQIWRTRNSRLKSALTAAQWRRYVAASYFYRPIGWRNGAYVHNIYVRYPKPACGKRYDKKHDKRYDKRHDKHHDKKFDKRRYDRHDKHHGKKHDKHHDKHHGRKDNHREPPRHGRR